MAEVAQAHSDYARSRLAPASVVAAAVCALLSVACVTLNLTMPKAVPADDTAGQNLLALPLVILGVVGFLLTWRRPDNRVGWLLSGCAITFALLLLGNDYQDHWLYAPDLPGGLVFPLAAVSALGWSFGFPALLVVVPALFPDGRLLSNRWRPVVGAAFALGVITWTAAILDPRFIGDGHREAPNPVGVPGGHDILSLISGPVDVALLVPLMVAGLVSLGIRYRRAGSDLRRQLKWFIAAVCVGVVSMVVAFATSFSATGIGAISVGFTALPVGIGIAVLKYRLYDIDVVISRTVRFVIMAGFITIVYVGVVVGIGALVGSSGRPNLLLSVLATAIVGVAFQPVFGRARGVANRLAYGRRATPYEALSELSVHLVDAYAGDELLPRVAQTVAEATAATGVEVWVRVGTELRSAAVWPIDAPASAPLIVTGQILPALGDARHALPVRHQGELLGAMTVSKRPGESLTPIEQKLVSDLAAQAGLMLRNVGLTADLQARLDDLRASRQRLVSAQDAERRRIERNLHDGAQQHLVALKIKLGILESITRKDPERAAALAAQVRGDADEALETLRDLARGIYPPLLASDGLVAALVSQARKAPIPVTVEDRGVERYAPEVEAAVYFCCLEALQNIAKYAHATSAVVRLTGSSEALLFEVVDDGAGFDAATAPHGSGLTNMVDRVDAVGGTVSVTSAPGQGTTVSGRLNASDIAVRGHS